MGDGARQSLEIETFIAEAKASGGAERANYQRFMIDLCKVLGLPCPDYTTGDTARDDYVFERRIAF